MQTSSNTLLIDDQSLVANGHVRRGTIHRCDLTIRNVGSVEEAAVNFWLEAPNPDSEILLNWYTFNPNPPLRVKRGEPNRITLSFEIPQQAVPSLYNYVIIFESAQYPGIETRRPLQLQVNPSEQDLELDMDPKFTVDPVTTSAKPHLLAPGDTLKAVITVENRSKLVDRFYLTCPELSPEWFTVQYPESPIETQGLIQESDGLPLNPKTKGEIVLLLHPPKYTLAGNYFPTLQLTSRNQEDLVLLDVAYLRVLPDDRVTIQLTPLIRRIPEEAGTFQLEVINLGNIKRSLLMRASDRNAFFDYTLEPLALDVSPGQQTQVGLIAKPRKWWRRPWRGKGLEFPFELELCNRQDSLAAEPLSVSEVAYLPALPSSLPQGTIVWQPRPWWLLLLLIGLPLLALIGLAIALWLNRPRSPEPPQVLGFGATKVDKGYQEGKGEPIRLDWAVSQLEQIDRITIIRLERGVETYRKNYYFNRIDDPQKNKISSHLQLKPGSQRKTNFCKEQPILKDAIEPKRRSNPLSLPFFPSSASSPSNSFTTTLVCQGIYTPTQKAGEYTFQIQVFQKQPNETAQSKDPIATRTTDTMTIKPSDEPQIVSFAPTQLLYQEPSPQTGTVASQVNNLEGVVRLNWKMMNVSRIEELRLISLAPDGSTQGEAKRYPIRDGLPPSLSRFCQLPTDLRELTCQNVPTDARRPGDYIYKLTAIVRGEQGTSELTKNTDPIKIQPKELRILSFKVNGKEASQKPKHVYLLGERGETVEIVLSWVVDGGEDAQVELSPSPGLVPRQGTISYSLSPPSTENITLKVSNRSGNQTSQSVVIQTIESQLPNSLDQLLPTPSPEAEPSPPASPPPQLAPIEIAPQPN